MAGYSRTLSPLPCSRARCARQTPTLRRKLLMTRDILFLLNPRFVAETGARQFCPDTMMIEGVLACFPDLRARLDVRYVDFPKPRKPIVEILGEERQGAP